jgi:hypothetical protein
VQLSWRKVFLDNLLEIIVDFLESHVSEYYPMGLINLRQPPILDKRVSTGPLIGQIVLVVEALSR